VVTGVHSGDGEEQPSRFLHELVPDERDGDAEPQATRLPRALSLGALVAELRVALTDPASGPGRRAAAAAALRRLADADVPGADPDQWWGLQDLSDDRPLADADDQIVVTPSTVEVVQRCSLRWLLERHGGRDAPTPEQGIGNLVHDAAMRATESTVDRADLIDYVVGRFGEIELSARWLADRERARAETMIDKLVGWLAGNSRRLAAIEREFLVQLDEGIQIKGRVDRLEIDGDGRLVVVDLKTGKTTSVKTGEVVDHPQLGAYQAAVEAGAFDDVGAQAGGAALVQLGTSHVEAHVQAQPALGDAADPGWASDMVRQTARTMAASTFRAVANSKCRNCPVRYACPVSGHGRQVTGGPEAPPPASGPVPVEIRPAQPRGPAGDVPGGPEGAG
jgi:RecB family exonuclease